MEVTNMRMTPKLCGKTFAGKIIYSELKKQTNVENIDMHFKGHFLQWFRHIKQTNESLAKVQEKTIVGNVRKRIKKTWETVKND